MMWGFTRLLEARRRRGETHRVLGDQCFRTWKSAALLESPSPERNRVIIQIGSFKTCSNLLGRAGKLYGPLLPVAYHRIAVAMVRPQISPATR